MLDHDALFLVIPVAQKKKSSKVLGAMIHCHFHIDRTSLFYTKFCDRTVLKLVFLTHDLLQGWHKQSSKSVTQRFAPASFPFNELEMPGKLEIDVCLWCWFLQVSFWVFFSSTVAGKWGYCKERKFVISSKYLKGSDILM